MRRRFKPRVPFLLLFYTSIFLTSIPGLIIAAIVTLDSIEIYKTHELLGSKPEVYFKCKGDNHTTYLPDVKKKHEVYRFKGEESWQPLTDLEEKKCKRCGIYEKDSFFKPDDVFDEWEFCASDFTSPDGKYIHFKDKEFNATFSCLECVPIEGASNNTTSSQSKGRKGMHWALVLLISGLASTFVVIGAVIAFKYWQKRKKQQEQARFLRLFEESDDIEDELGIGPLSHVI